MAIFHDNRRRSRRSLDETARGTDAALNWLVVLLLIGCGIAAWLSYGRVSPDIDRTSAGAPTTGQPAAPPASPGASPAQPASPNPSP